MRFLTRRRGIVLGALLTTLITGVGMSACSVPVTYSVIKSTGGIFDAGGNMMIRLGNNETIGYDAGSGYWTRNDGTGYYQRIGWNAIVPTSYWYAIPIDASGPVGPLRSWVTFWGFQTNNRYSIANFDIKFGFDYGNVHVGIPEGTCYLQTWYKNDGSAFTGIDHGCTNVRTAATRDGVAYTPPPAEITGPYADLTAAQKAQVQTMITEARTLGDKTMVGAK